MATAYDMWATGEIGASRTHPNSPAYVEPDFGLDDAARNVADRLHEDGETGALVEAVARSRALLDWIAANAELPRYLLASFRELDGQARTLGRACEAELEALNAPGGEP